MNAKLVKTSRLILAILFIFSAISKLISLPFFDGMVAELIIGLDYYNHPQALWYTQLFTRILISGELLLGAAILQEKHLKKIILPVVQFMLLVFTLHLFYEGSRSGFVDGNCGCFGDVLPMTNLESIIKNIIAMLIGFAISKYYKEDKDMRFKTWVMPVSIGLVCLATLFLSIKNYAAKSINKNVSVNELPKNNKDKLIIADTSISEKTKIDSNNKNIKKEENIIVANNKIEKKKEDSKTLTADQITKNLLQQYANFNGETKMNLNEGEQLVCLFSLTCSHCQQAYRELCAISQEGKLPAIYLFTYGTDFNQNFFFNQAGDCKHPYSRTENYTDFKRILEGEGFPRILVFKEGKIIQKWLAETFSEKAFRDYFGIAKQEKKKDDTDGLDLDKDNDSPWGNKDSPWE